MTIPDEIRDILKTNVDLENIDLNTNRNPHDEALKIAFLYGLFSVVWIFLLNGIVPIIFKDSVVIRKVEFYRGWIYVVVTTVSLYLLIKNQLFVFKNEAEKNKKAYEDINIAYKTLKEAEEKLHQRTYYNELTKLPNLIYFEEKVYNILEEKKAKNGKVALIYLDIDNLKYVNNTVGYEHGNKLLTWISNTLKHHIKEPNIVSHISGDEFLILIDDISDTEHILSEVKKIQSLVNRFWRFGKQEIFVSVSIGVAVYPEHGNELPVLLKNAEYAMYCEKEKGKGGYSLYSEVGASKILEFNWIINELKEAIKNEEFLLYYQPLIDLELGGMDGVEVLIRWNHPTKGWIQPQDFLPVAEASGLIVDIGKWVFEKACEQKKIWMDKGYGDVKISINISGKELIKENLFSNIKEIIDKYQLKHTNIQVEIKETAAMSNLDKSISVFEQFKSLGLKIALDAFGMGYSSLSYLETLPIDVIKIDRSFVDKIKHAKQNEKIINVIIQLSHILNLEVVAQGVETKEQVVFLKRHRCNFGQGYLFCEPLPTKEIENLLENNNNILAKVDG